MKFKLLFIVAAMISLCSYAQTRSELIKKADICFSQQDYNCAETNYKKAIEMSEINQDEMYILYANLGTAQYGE